MAGCHGRTGIYKGYERIRMLMGSCKCRRTGMAKWSEDRSPIPEERKRDPYTSEGIGATVNVYMTTVRWTAKTPEHWRKGHHRRGDDARRAGSGRENEKSEKLPPRIETNKDGSKHQRNKSNEMKKMNCKAIR